MILSVEVTNITKVVFIRELKKVHLTKAPKLFQNYRTAKVWKDDVSCYKVFLREIHESITSLLCKTAVSGY